MEVIKSYKEVKCPATMRIEKVYYKRITETVLVEVYGCDHSNGSGDCQRCLAKILEELTSR